MHGIPGKEKVEKRRSGVPGESVQLRKRGGRSCGINLRTVAKIIIIGNFGDRETKSRRQEGCLAWLTKEGGSPSNGREVTTGGVITLAVNGHNRCV